LAEVWTQKLPNVKPRVHCTERTFWMYFLGELVYVSLSAVYYPKPLNLYPWNMLLVSSPKTVRWIQFLF
jgi:hypothetical protein